MKVRDVALPEGDTTRPVAGYLFFPAPKKRGGQIQLKYFRDGIDVVLVLPQPK
jgi:hypothetical protein